MALQRPKRNWREVLAIPGQRLLFTDSWKGGEKQMTSWRPSVWLTWNQTRRSETRLDSLTPH